MFSKEFDLATAGIIVNILQVALFRLQNVGAANRCKMTDPHTPRCGEVVDSSRLISTKILRGDVKTLGFEELAYKE